MPYIKVGDRSDLNRGDRHEKTAGELNYSITKLCIKYLKNHGENYQTYNDIIGALEGCKLEFYRRQVAEYENDKVIQNGDVFEKELPTSDLYHCIEVVMDKLEELEDKIDG